MGTYNARTSTLTDAGFECDAVCHHLALPPVFPLKVSAQDDSICPPAGSAQAAFACGRCGHGRRGKKRHLFPKASARESPVFCRCARAPAEDDEPLFDATLLAHESERGAADQREPNISSL